MMRRNEMLENVLRKLNVEEQLTHAREEMFEILLCYYTISIMVN